jgi:hypothetical protein
MRMRDAAGGITRKGRVSFVANAATVLTTTMNAPIKMIVSERDFLIDFGRWSVVTGNFAER